MSDLAILPVRTAGAAENMAIDFLLLQRWPGAAGVPRFRHYEWRGPAFTFGYSQKIEFIREQLPPQEEGVRFDLCRRATGGGLVDHRDDWTYALVIPRGHALEEARATESYRMVHACIAEALRVQGVEAKLATTPAMTPSAAPQTQAPTATTPGLATLGAMPGVCFQKSEIHDVVAASGAKIAGAAQKRNKQGLLFQGSISRAAAGEGAVRAVNWDQFESDFTTKLGAQLGATAVPSPWPDFNEDELEALIEQYGTPEWMEGR
jgi:lipoate-protein ligase A